jgi:hypothetical protein
MLRELIILLTATSIKPSPARASAVRLKLNEFLNPEFDFQRFLDQLVIPFLYGQLFFLTDEVYANQFAVTWKTPHKSTTKL